MVLKKAYEKITIAAQAGLERRRPLMDVGIFTMFAGATSQLVEWSNFHLNAGAKALYIFLDRPSEGQLKSLPKHKAITYVVNDEGTLAALYPGETPNVERKQTDSFYRALKMAENDGCKHLAFIDSDELIQLETSLVEIAAASQADVLRIRAREMWRAEGDPVDEPFGASLALYHKPDAKLNWHDVLGWKTPYARDGFMAHTLGKAVYKLPYKGGKVSVHGPVFGYSSLVEEWVDEEIAGLLHFDAGSFDSWQRKWYVRHIGDSNATGMGPTRRMKYALMGDVLSRSIKFQKEFFADFYTYTDDAARLLEEHELVQRIDISKALRGPLKTPKYEDVEQEDLQLDLEKADFQFGFVTDDNFAAPTFAAMLSVIHQLPEASTIRLIVLGDSLKKRSIEKLYELETIGERVTVRFHDITSRLNRDVGKGDKKRATFGRVYFSEFLPPQRTIYLDSDVLATRDFSELFSLDLGGACLAGVPDSAAFRCKYLPESVSHAQRVRLESITKGEESVEYYLNGGVLIMDLENFEFRRLASELRHVITTLGARLTQRDQDAVNLVFAGKKKLIDAKYNYMTQFFTSGFAVAGGIREVKNKFSDASLVHFSGKVKPWVSKELEFFNALYRRLVLEFENALGVSCDFFFSEVKKTLPKTNDLVIDGSNEKPAISVVDVATDGLFISMSEAVETAVTGSGYWLSLQSGTSVLAEIPLTALPAPQIVIGTSIGMPVRKLPLDLKSALSSVGGFANDVHFNLCVVLPDGTEGHRNLAVAPGLSSDLGGNSAKLESFGATGVLEKLSKKTISGWAKINDKSAETLSVYVDGHLHAVIRPNEWRKDIDAHGYAFLLSTLDLHVSERTPQEISVKVPLTNIHLRRSPIIVTAKTPYVYDKKNAIWVNVN